MLPAAGDDGVVSGRSDTSEGDVLGPSSNADSSTSGEVVERVS